ncbi:MULTISPECIES: SDR family NAD(P)-dependent oxidoreductase [unclassified Methylobacterium]|jgi:NAD(P)-dependent dehydrogenase (short-subunit alcohol dehydrogenase family)|uniref:SDR family NAD(P)-dependent oxidoreductase n=1 Tax=unclassified Methylobacterium TaxID=2615210 RepID=UPI0013540929|nr:SDR family NAD(P)-dependent oxidoreductase [Methylobacterium sp. 2A]MWV20967.1 SDR family NAD(P)-dependent oxidoreductase [Methylobacterium sp. 2A]
MAARVAIVVGAGAVDGLGAALARRFAAEGLTVLVAGRTQRRLGAIVAGITEAGGRGEAVPTDATDEAQVAALFARGRAIGRPELVVFNAGGNLPAPALDLGAGPFETLWRQSALGGFLVGREAARHLPPSGGGTLLVTGATASLRARPPFLGFASAKAALRAVAQGLAREFGPEGLHVVHVVIDGVLQGDYAATHFPTLVAARGAEGLLSVADVADLYWFLHTQPRSAWTHELDVRPFKEPF